jgi:biotin carboxyl carrier protein
MGRLIVTIEGYSYEVELVLPPRSEVELSVQVNGKEVRVSAPELDGALDSLDWFIVDGRSYEVAIDPEFRWLRSRWGVAALEIQDLETPSERIPQGNGLSGRIKAPIPGQVTQVMVAEGDLVVSGQALLVLEAMKMENEIRAPLDGSVKALNVAPGQRVALNEVLVEIE